MPRSNKKGAAVPRGAAPPQSAGRGKEMAQSRNLKPSAGTVGGAAATTPYRLEILQLEPCALRKRGGDDDDYFKGGQACCSSTRVAACLARCPVPDAQQHLPPDHSARPRPVFAGVRASGTPRPRPRRGGRVHRQRIRHALARGPARWAGGSAVQPCSLPGAEDVYNSTGVGCKHTETMLKACRSASGCSIRRAASRTSLTSRRTRFSRWSGRARSCASHPFNEYCS